MKYRVLDWGHWADKFCDAQGMPNEEGRAVLLGAAKHYVSGVPRLDDAMQDRTIQEYTSQSDFPLAAKTVVNNWFLSDYEVDLAWQAFFETFPVTTPTFTIGEVSDAITFRKLDEGGKIKPVTISGTDQTVHVDRFGGGVELDLAWWADQQYWKSERAMKMFRQGSASIRRDVCYTLIEAATNTTAWANPTPAGLANTDAQYVLSRDINTINAACVDIINALDQSSGIPVSASSEFVLLAPLALRSRILSAIRATQAGTDGVRGAGQIDYSVRPFFSTNLSSNSLYYVAIPGQQMLFGERAQLALRDKVSILGDTLTMAGVQRFGAVIGNQNQLTKCSTS